MTYGKILRYAQNDKVSSYREPQRICYIRKILRSLCSLRMTDDGQPEAHSLRMTGVIVCIICVADGNILRNCDILLKIIRVCSYS